MCYYGYVQWTCGCAPDNQMRVPTALSCLENGDSCTRSETLGNLDGTLGSDGKLRLNYICPNCQYNNENPEYNPHGSSRNNAAQPRTTQHGNNASHSSRGSSRQTRAGPSRTARNDSQAPSHQTGPDQPRTSRHRSERTTTSTRERSQSQENLAGMSQEELEEEYERFMRGYVVEMAAIERETGELRRELDELEELERRSGSVRRN